MALLLLLGSATNSTEGRAVDGNLVTNGDFAEDTGAWIHAPADATWTPAYEGQPGVIRLVNNIAADQTLYTYAEQCIPIMGSAPGRWYTISGRMFATAGQNRLAGLFVNAGPNSGLECNGSWLYGPGGWQEFGTTETGAWLAGADTGSLPQGTRSVRISLGVGKTAPRPGGNPSDPVEGYFDDIVLKPADGISFARTSAVARD